MKMTGNDIVTRFRKDMDIKDSEWNKLCRRYAYRSISTILWYAANMYGRLPSDTGRQFKKELEKNANV